MHTYTHMHTHTELDRVRYRDDILPVEQTTYIHSYTDPHIYIFSLIHPSSHSTHTHENRITNNKKIMP